LLSLCPPGAISCRAREGDLRLKSTKTTLGLGLLAAGLGAALLLALFSPLASSSPDGLERVAEEKGFAQNEREPPFEVIAGYVFPWVDNDEAANVLAGMTGVLLVAGLTSGLVAGLQRLSRRSQGRAGEPQATADRKT